jgi:hypothetical protein
VEGEGGSKPCRPWDAAACGTSSFVAAAADPTLLAEVAWAAWLPRAAPSAAPAVSAAAPHAAQAVVVRTRRRAPDLSIGMREGSIRAVSRPEALSKRFV